MRLLNVACKAAEDSDQISGSLLNALLGSCVCVSLIQHSSMSVIVDWGTAAENYR